MQNFLTEKDVARQISVSLASLRRWRLLQLGPRFVIRHGGFHNGG